MWNNDIYFIVQRYNEVNRSYYQCSMELRQLQGCEDQYPFTESNPMGIDNCSVHINTVISDFACDTNPYSIPLYKPANELFITERGGKLEFMLQIHNNTFDDSHNVIDCFSPDPCENN